MDKLRGKKLPRPEIADKEGFCLPVRISALSEDRLLIVRVKGAAG